MTYEHELQVAVSAARQAGTLIRDGYGQSFQSDEKGIGDLVCEIDRNADAAVQSVIKKSFPDDAILSEELAPDVDSHEGRLWIIDPLDGTAGFLYHAGEQIPSVLIALQVDGITQVGVAYVPLTDELFSAVKGEGAWKNDVPLQKPIVPKLEKAWVEMNHYGDVAYESEVFRYLRDRLRQPGGACVMTVGMPHSGSALRVIEQNTDLAMVIHDNDARKVKQAAWDVAVPQLVMEELGGGFWNMKGERYDLFSPELFIVAGSKELADSIVALVAKSGEVG